MAAATSARLAWRRGYRLTVSLKYAVRARGQPAAAAAQAAAPGAQRPAPERRSGGTAPSRRRLPFRRRLVLLAR